MIGNTKSNILLVLQLRGLNPSNSKRVEGVAIFLS